MNVTSKSLKIQIVNISTRTLYAYPYCVNIRSDVDHEVISVVNFYKERIIVLQSSVKLHYLPQATAGFSATSKSAPNSLVIYIELLNYVELFVALMTFDIDASSRLHQ